MAIAVVATLLTPHVLSGSATVPLIAAGSGDRDRGRDPGGAARCKMTAMPQMVALFNGVGGGAVALIAWVEYRHHYGGDFALQDRDPVAVRGDRRLDLVLGFEHRVRQASGDPPGPPDQAPRANVHQSRPAADRGRIGGRAGRRYPLAGAVHPRDPRVRGGARKHGRAADRRCRHAGRDLAAERVHRPVRGRDRNRARQHGADRRRDDRRRLWHDPHQPDGQGDEPIGAGDRRRRIRRRGRGAGRRCGRGWQRALDHAPRTSRSSCPTRVRS